MTISKELLIRILTPITILSTGAGLLAFLASYVNPEYTTIPAFMGLGMPVILSTNLVLCIFWIVLKKWRSIIPGFIILLNTAYLSSVYQVTFSSSSSSAPDIKLTTYNVRDFKSWDLFPSQYNITTYLKEQQVNIVCFQEYLDYGILNTDSLSKLLELPYYAVALLPKSTTQGLAIFSKFPIVQSGRIDFQSNANNATWADIKISNQIVRIFNCHLQTTDFNSKHRKLKQGGNFDQTSSIFGKMFGDLSKNFKLRAIQADIIRQMIDTTRVPVIVCGDFNDTPASYTYHHIKNNLHDSFKTQGNGYSYTFKGLRRMLRIDFIFYSPQMECISYQSPELEWSDHNPVISEFLFVIP